MAGHQRPLFVLFGASLSENAFQPGGWGASLADYYSRKADVLVRGYTGWNTRRAVAVLEKFFPKDHPSQPALVVVFFGSNDAAFPLPSGMGQNVPITEYKANLRQICAHIKGLSDTSRVVLITPSPVFDEARRAYARCKWGSFAGKYPDRTNQRAQEYAEVCIEVAKEMDVGVVDLWNAIQRTKDWETECLRQNRSSFLHPTLHLVLHPALNPVLHPTLRLIIGPALKPWAIWRLSYQQPMIGESETWVFFVLVASSY